MKAASRFADTSNHIQLLFPVEACADTKPYYVNCSYLAALVIDTPQGKLIDIIVDFSIALLALPAVVSLKVSSIETISTSVGEVSTWVML